MKIFFYSVSFSYECVLVFSNHVKLIPLNVLVSRMTTLVVPPCLFNSFKFDLLKTLLFYRYRSIILIHYENNAFQNYFIMTENVDFPPHVCFIMSTILL